MTEDIARSDWEQRIGRRSDERSVSKEALPRPEGLRAEPGRGQVTLRWTPVEGAAGYVVYRGDPDGPLERLDFGGGDVLATPAPPFSDTGGEVGRAYSYAVASLVAADAPPGGLSEPVEAASSAGGEALVDVLVDAGSRRGRLVRPWRMIGSEHLSQLTYGPGPGPGSIGEEFAAALRMARDELGAQTVRAHAILDDELKIIDRPGDEPAFDAVDTIYDRVLELGLRPIVEVSFMPRALARDPDATVFTYKGIISPPRDIQEWGELNRSFAAHLVERYGIDEVAEWAFEIWNEANLEVFWTGSQQEYFELYESAARAIKSVSDRLRVGGPSTAASGWIPAFVDYCVERDVPMDFVSTHVYGIPPLDLKAYLAKLGIAGVPVWWTEWGVTPTHFAPVNDSAFGAPFVLRGMKQAQASDTEALSYWVISDHFEELGRPPRLFHGGFGLLTVGNLRKPRYWALALAEQLGDDEVAVRLTGDGADSLVDGIAARSEDGTVQVLVWNGTYEQSQIDGEASLCRRLRVTIDGLEGSTYDAVLARVDADNSNIARHGRPDEDWPDAARWEELRKLDRLSEHDLGTHQPVDGRALFELDLPMPGVARLRLTPH